MPNNHTMQKAQPEIFFSYAWGGESEPYALALYESLQKAGYKGIMDRYAVGYKESFTEFMKRIGRGSFIIVLVNDKYLKSDFCMFEFLEIFRKSSSELNEMGAKLFPIVFNDAKLRDFKDALAYANFWKAQANDLDATLTDIGRRYTTGWNDTYKVFDEISTNIGDFAKWLRGHNTLSPDKLAENDFAIIKQAIAEREAWLATQTDDATIKQTDDATIKQTIINIYNDGAKIGQQNIDSDVNNSGTHFNVS
jgi:internalin A